MTSDNKYAHFAYCLDVVSGKIRADTLAQLKCANDLNNRRVENDGAITLANLIYWLQAEIEFKLTSTPTCPQCGRFLDRFTIENQLKSKKPLQCPHCCTELDRAETEKQMRERMGYLATGNITRHASEQFFSRVLADIRSGKLIVRNIVHLIPVNDAPDVQAAINGEVFSEAFAEMSTRVVVKKDEARAWLERLGAVPIPEWLVEKSKSDTKKRNKKTPREFKKALDLLFDEITNRAKKDGKDFDRYNAPGIVKDLLEVACKFNPALDYELTTFSEYRKYHCKFLGRKPGVCTFYRDLFPEYFH